MKIRNGFVSNSSSASFILIADDGHFNVRKDKYVIVKVSGPVNYCRGDIMKIESIEDKIKCIISVYAYWYCEDKDYYFKMDDAKKKIISLGKKYDYKVSITPPPLYGSVSTSRYNYDLDKFETCEKWVRTYVDVSYEMHFADDIVKMIEREDTSELESFLFNEHSFGILGGDEYDETYELAKEARSGVNYPYHRYSDDGFDDDEWGKIDKCPY